MSKRVLVIGDTILDIYCFGSVERISPEAPIPIYDYDHEEYILGGACNVAANIKSLSEEKVTVDYFGYYSVDVYNLLDEYKIKCIGVPISPNEVLTKKRFVCNKHQLLRVDNRKKYNDEDLAAVNFLQIKQMNYEIYDVIVISDYNKGTLNGKEFGVLVSVEKPKIIDLKCIRPDMWSYSFDNCILKCNMKEYMSNSDIVNLGAKVIVTTGNDGYWLPQTNERFPVAKRSDGVIDVVGAGDVFLAGMAINYLESGGFDIYAMSAFGNLAASEKVKHFGTVAVKRDLI